MSALSASNWPCHQSPECQNLHLQPHHTLGCTDSFISFQQHLSTQNLFAEWNIFFNTWCLLWPKPWIFQISLLWIQHKNEPPQDQKGAWTRNFTCMAADKWKPGTHSHISKNWLHMATVHHSSQRIPWNKPLQNLAVSGLQDQSALWSTFPWPEHSEMRFVL